MMMEQQIVLKNNIKMQEKWETCIMTTCYAYRTVERMKEAIENLHDVVRQIINNLAELFKPVMKSLTLVFEEFRDFIDRIDDFYNNEKIYPQGYPHYVNNLKVNTKGFPKSITHCARSRC